MPIKTVASLHRSTAVLPSSLPRFLTLYTALFAAFGAASPFLPGLLMQDGLSAGQLGVVLAAGTGIRLITGPLGGRFADRTGRAPMVSAGLAATSAVVALGYVPARGLPSLLLVSVGHAAVLAPLTPIADALSLGSSQAKPGFQYGWVRAAGSGAFIAGTLLSGLLIQPLGLGVVIWINAVLLAAAALCCVWLPNQMAGTEPQDRTAHSAFRALLGIRIYVRIMAAAALIGGSHALHDGFEVIRWRSAGLSAAECSWLWALSVAAEILVFLVAGQRLLTWLGPVGAVALSATAGIVRWGTAAETAHFPIMALVEPLHGLTFALLHLACMDVIAKHVPSPYAATAQAVYATGAMGITAAAVTLASGPLYGSLGAHAFWAMAVLCAAALPVALTIRAVKQ